jgi:hypothetical protein
MNSTKICSKCQQEKSLINFYKHKKCKYGVRSNCKDCSKQSYLKNKDKTKIQRQNNYIKNKAKLLLQNKQWRLKHKKERNLYGKQWRLNNPKKCKQFELNRRVKRRKYEKQRRKNDTIYRLVTNHRRRIRQALKTQGVKKSLRSMESLGCSSIQYQEYIKSLLHSGMVLENNGPRKWIIHHIHYINTFNLKDREEQKKAFHYTNCIPMWKDEHIQLHKNDSIIAAA